MTSPFDAVRAAVGRYGAGATSGTPGAGSAVSGHPGAAGGVSAGGVFTPRLPAIARYDTARLQHVATYPATGYARLLRRLATVCSLFVPVHIYVGAIADTARETSYGDGSLADFDPQTPPYIPGGASVFVVWDTANSAATASCTATFEQTT